MVRENLAGIPVSPLPRPYSFRWYEAGDERHWTRIQRRADRYNTITARLFRQQFGDDAPALAKRVGFLCDEKGRPIGTAAAWFDRRYDGRRYGRLHWVAIVPKFQGKGLAKPLLSTVCSRLRALGHVRAYLTTNTVRMPAIRLYLGFGFRPRILNEKDERAWAYVRQKLRRNRRV
ncbi:MAG: GNAT family N-acetyltransferase [Kiritimatiellae bacterium]|nr:GNAT family N-acetyltransferase [Kiritimatiellia bacterium]